MRRLGRATCFVHLISARTSQEGIKCTKAKEYIRAYCPNMYCAFLSLPPYHCNSEQVCSRKSMSIPDYTPYKSQKSEVGLNRVQKALNQATNHRFTLCSAIYSGLCCSFYPFDTIWVLFACQFLCIFLLYSELLLLQQNAHSF